MNNIMDELNKIQRYMPDMGVPMIYSGQEQKHLVWVHIDDLRALLDRSPSVSAPIIPEGYELVPIELTDEMFEAGKLSLKHGYWSKAYTEMLSANQGSDKDEHF